jgi:type VI secretion system protein VasG
MKPAAKQSLQGGTLVATMNLKLLMGKLNTACRRALEGAAGLCLSRTNYNVEAEHWLLKLMEPADTDLPRVFKHYGLDISRINRDVTRAVDKFKTGNAQTPPLSTDLVDLMREAWTVASLNYGAARIRSSHVLVALLQDNYLGPRLREISPELAKLSTEKLATEVPALISGTAEDQPEAGTPPAVEGGPTQVPGSKTPALDQFTLNLTENARSGKLDPVVGRDHEIRQVVDILTRRRQNNPILTGEAGVGKTAVVEGFALRIVAGDVPEVLKNVAVRTLDLGLLQAGAGVKGEFENRLKSVIAEVKASPQPIILFIDEAHTLIGAGGSAGQGDAANLLKPALARGELRTIAATTWAEYKKFFEKDAALKRRFQVVKVDEPDEAKAVRMMRGITPTLEKHHKVRILEEAVEDAVKLSHRYITDRQLPDKSVSLLDTVCARVALGLCATPPALEDCRREIEHIGVEIGILEREMGVGAAHDERLKELTERRDAAQTRLEALEKRWKAERSVAEDILKLREKLETHVAACKEKTAEGRLKEADEKRFRSELAQKEKELAVLQGESPLVQPVVDGQAVAEVVSAWTGIPVGKMVLDEIKTVLTLKEKMAERIIGQDHALEAIAQRIRTARANLVDPRRPNGVFLLVGPSGVGKTESACALADILYGGERNMVVINMSEYQEAHTVSGLKGSPPGYVGYGEGGVLTEAVRRKPYSIVLLDEIEKAHPDVIELFYQVFDKGMLEDAEGREVDFKNTIILCTSNVGTDTIMKLCADPDTKPDAEGLAAALRPDLLGKRQGGEAGFKPAFLGRLTVVPYFPLGDDVIRKIIHLQLGRIGDRLRLNHKAALTYDDALVNAVAARCTEVESGARNVDHILTGTLLPEISREFLSRMAEGKPPQKVHVSVDKEGKFVYQIK